MKILQTLTLAIFLFVANFTTAQSIDTFNCLTRGERQLTQFFVEIDGVNSDKIVNNSPYTVKFTAEQKTLTLKPNEATSGNWINENTRMENCSSVTADGVSLSTMKSAVDFRNDFESFHSAVQSVGYTESETECNKQIASLKAKLNEIRNWKSRIPRPLWNGYFEGDMLIKTCEGLIEHFENRKKSIQQTTASNVSSNQNTSTTSNDSQTNNNTKQTQAQQQANEIIAKIQTDQKERERQSEIQGQKLTQATTELVEVGTAFFQGLAQDREQERQRLSRQKASLEESLASKFETAKNGDDQSYYDIYLAYKNAKFKEDAQKFKDLAYATGNTSVFEAKKSAYKAQQKLDNQSSDGLYLGLQYGLFSTYGLSINVPAGNWGLLMMFRSNFKKGDVGYMFKDEKLINRDIYIEDNSAIMGSDYRYTFLEEGDEKQFARTVTTIGVSRLIKFPFFVYATVGYGAIGKYSLQQKETVWGNNNQFSRDEGNVEINESIESFATDFGAMIKLNRYFVISAGVSTVKFKYPEIVFGLNINLFNPSSIMEK